MQILVVEDELDVADLLGARSRRWVTPALLARDTKRANQLLEENAVDAVTLDLGMPDVDGLEWWSRWRRPGPTLREALVITGKFWSRSRFERLARCGAGVLAKPFTQAA